MAGPAAYTLEATLAPFRLHLGSCSPCHRQVSCAHSLQSPWIFGSNNNVCCFVVQRPPECWHVNTAGQSCITSASRMVQSIAQAAMPHPLLLLTPTPRSASYTGGGSGRREHSQNCPKHNEPPVVHMTQYRAQHWWCCFSGRSSSRRRRAPRCTAGGCRCWSATQRHCPQAGGSQSWRQPSAASCSRQSW